MSSRRFLSLGLGLALGLVLTCVGFNIAMDEFGLYGLRRGEIRIWGYERASKFLLAQRYVPEHFDGLLLGSSSADMMMDTRKIDGYRIYNLSITGGNICELKRVADEALSKGTIRFVILSLSPYLTKDCQMKTNELNPRLRLSALGSLFTVRFYQAKLKALLSPGSDPFRDSHWGFQYDTPAPADDQASIATRGPRYDPRMTPAAAEALAELLKNARTRGIRVFAYLHPLQRSAWPLNPEYNPEYVQSIRDILGDSAEFWDFGHGNLPELTEDPAAYLRGSHLSERGADILLGEIKRRLDAASVNAPDRRGQP